MHLFLTIDVEEWFMSTKILDIDQSKPYWEESDIEETVTFLQDLLEEHHLKGTFFFIQEIAQRFPHLVQRLINAGHEIALHGETHAHLSTLSVEEFRAMVERTKDFFKKTFDLDLKGYRAPYFSIHKEALGILKQSGFIYDSSVVPSLHIPGWYGVPHAPLNPYRIGETLDSVDEKGQFLELPMSVHPRWRVPGGGGYYFRNLGFHYTVHVLKSCLRRLGYAMFYIHPWELSRTIPEKADLPFYMRRRTGDWTREALARALKEITETFPIQNSTLHEYTCNFLEPKAWSFRTL